MNNYRNNIYYDRGHTRALRPCRVNLCLGLGKAPLGMWNVSRNLRGVAGVCQAAGVHEAVATGVVWCWGAGGGWVTSSDFGKRESMFQYQA